MKNSILLISIIFLFASDLFPRNPIDENYLHGRWWAEKSENGYKIKSYADYLDDGTYIEETTARKNDSGPVVIEVSIQGKWSVDKNIFKLKITRSSHPDLAKLGDVYKCRLKMIDDNRMEIKNLTSGDTHISNRDTSEIFGKSSKTVAVKNEKNEKNEKNSIDVPVKSMTDTLEQKNNGIHFGVYEGILGRSERFDYCYHYKIDLENRIREEERGGVVGFDANAQVTQMARYYLKPKEPFYLVEKFISHVVYYKELGIMVLNDEKGRKLVFRKCVEGDNFVCDRPASLLYPEEAFKTIIDSHTKIVKRNLFTKSYELIGIDEYYASVSKEFTEWINSFIKKSGNALDMVYSKADADYLLDLMDPSTYRHLSNTDIYWGIAEIKPKLKKNLYSTVAFEKAREAIANVRNLDEFRIQKSVFRRDYDYLNAKTEKAVNQLFDERENELVKSEMVGFFNRVESFNGDTCTLDDWLKLWDETHDSLYFRSNHERRQIIDNELMKIRENVYERLWETIEKELFEKEGFARRNFYKKLFPLKSDKTSSQFMKLAQSVLRQLENERGYNLVSKLDCEVKIERLEEILFGEFPGLSTEERGDSKRDFYGEFYWLTLGYIFAADKLYGSIQANPTVTIKWDTVEVKYHGYAETSREVISEGEPYSIDVTLKHIHDAPQIFVAAAMAKDYRDGKGYNNVKIGIFGQEFLRILEGRSYDDPLVLQWIDNARRFYRGDMSVQQEIKFYRGIDDELSVEGDIDNALNLHVPKAWRGNSYWGY